MAGPTREQLQAAYGGTIRDVITPGLRVLFVGINPSLYSAATGHHFARPGNRFWPALHLAGFTPRQLDPSQQGELLAYGVGVTNLVDRGTATAAELAPEELRASAETLCKKLRRHRPQAVAFLGVTTYRIGFADTRAAIGRLPADLEGCAAWVLPNPSGLNAHYQLPQLAALYGELRASLPDVPAPDCWLHPEVEVRSSRIEGKGLFASSAISEGTIVARFGGRLVSTEELEQLFAARPNGGAAVPYIDSITVTESTHLVLPSRRPGAYGNHSCDPNLWWVGLYTLAARRDIAAGEELTNDYATCTAVATFSMECSCGSTFCRGTVTGEDWRLSSLQSTYGEHWVPALLRRTTEVR